MPASEIAQGGASWCQHAWRVGSDALVLHPQDFVCDWLASRMEKEQRNQRVCVRKIRMQMVCMSDGPTQGLESLPATWRS